MFLEWRQAVKLIGRAVPQADGDAANGVEFIGGNLAIIGEFCEGAVADAAGAEVVSEVRLGRVARRREQRQIQD